MGERRIDRTALRVTALTAAALLAGCDDARRTSAPARLCVDGAGRRLADAACGSSGHGGGHFYYVGSGASVPDEGDRVAGGSVRPEPGVRYAPVDDVVRGGFGGTAEGGGEAGGEGGGHGGAGE